MNAPVCETALMLTVVCRSGDYKDDHNTETDLLQITMLKQFKRGARIPQGMRGVSTCLECGATTHWQLLIRGSVIEGEMIHAEWCSVDLRNVRHRIVVHDDSDRCDSIHPNYREDR
jgi:hypothetical protein